MPQPKRIHGLILVGRLLSLGGILRVPAASQNIPKNNSPSATNLLTIYFRIPDVVAIASFNHYR